MIQTLIWLSLFLAVASATQYECLPYPEKSMCMLDFIYYQPGEPITFPTGYDHYRITASRFAKNKSNVTIFDEALYEAMHRPSRIEMANIDMENLTLPPELQLGNFASNGLYSVTVEAERNYQISFLDLESNYLKDITFVSRLVNLETLHLENNLFFTFLGSVLAPLTKLKYLYLGYSGLKSISWIDLPRTLIHLDCSHARVESAEFINVSLPSLEYLSLQENSITTINVTALLRAAPRLKEAHLQNVLMTGHELDQLKVTLTSNNISFIDTIYRNYCHYQYARYEYSYEKCVRKKGGTGRAILMSGVVIGMAAIFIYIVVLTFRYMNR